MAEYTFTLVFTLAKGKKIRRSGLLRWEQEGVMMPLLASV